jgi:hypothetical protein
LKFIEIYLGFLKLNVSDRGFGSESPIFWKLGSGVGSNLDEKSLNLHEPHNGGSSVDKTFQPSKIGYQRVDSA